MIGKSRTVLDYSDLQLVTFADISRDLGELHCVLHEVDEIIMREQQFRRLAGSAGYRFDEQPDEVETVTLGENRVFGIKVNFA